MEPKDYIITEISGEYATLTEKNKRRNAVHCTGAFTARQ